MRTMTGGAGDRPRHCTHPAAELAGFSRYPHAPDRAPASTTTVAAEMAPSSRERARNRCRVGGADPRGSSLTSAPTSPTRSSKSRFPVRVGAVHATGGPTIASPPADNAAQCAAASTP